MHKTAMGAIAGFPVQNYIETHYIATGMLYQYLLNILKVQNLNELTFAAT